MSMLGVDPVVVVIISCILFFIFVFACFCAWRSFCAWRRRRQMLRTRNRNQSRRRQLIQARGRDRSDLISLPDAQRRSEVNEESVPLGDSEDQGQIIESGFRHQNIGPGEDAAGGLQRRPTPWLFPFSWASPYTKYLRQKWDQLESHPVAKHNCIMDHGGDCGLACESWNCHDTAFRILADIAQGSEYFPRVPLHPQILYSVMMIMLTKAEVREFFEAPSPVASPGSAMLSGALKVDEFCYLQGQEIPTDQQGLQLQWSHTFIIKRHGNQCDLLQSDEQKFSLRHWIQRDAKFPESVDVGVHEQKSFYNYDKASPGQSCDAVYAAYLEAYREITSIKQFQLSCLAYYEKLDNLQQVTSQRGAMLFKRDLVQMRYDLEMGRQEVLKRFRTGDVDMRSSCFDEAIFQLDLQTEFRPGNAIYLEDTLLEFMNRTQSMSGKALRCTAVASVPKNRHAPHLYQDLK